MAVCNLNNVTVKTDRVTAINTRAGTAAVAKIYTGTPPGDASMAATGTLLATLPCSNPFGTVTAGVSGGAKPFLTLGAITTVNAVANGTPGYVRFQDGSGNGVVDLDCGAAGAGAYCTVTPDLATSGAPISISSAVITEA